VHRHCPCEHEGDLSAARHDSGAWEWRGRGIAKQKEKRKGVRRRRNRKAKEEGEEEYDLGRRNEAENDWLEIDTPYDWN
jgi:hypothetical protein